MKFFEDLQDFLELKLVAGNKGIENIIKIPTPQKPGLALLGDASHLTPYRIQIIGRSEANYIQKLKSNEQKEILQTICQAYVPCFVMTRDTAPPKTLLECCEEFSIPVFKTPLATNIFNTRASEYLKEKLNESTIVHGCLISVIGVGILIIGKSGIGKSECALDLIAKGHQFIADDIVQIVKQDTHIVQGYYSQILNYHMEVRGLGIINIQDLFGVAAVRPKKIINLVVELVEWEKDADYDRLGTEQERYEILGVEVPCVRFPVSPSRHLSTLIEVAARNELLKRSGKNTALEFAQMIDKKVLGTDFFVRGKED